MAFVLMRPPVCAQVFLHVQKKYSPYQHARYAMECILRVQNARWWWYRIDSYGIIRRYVIKWKVLIAVDFCLNIISSEITFELICSLPLRLVRSHWLLTDGKSLDATTLLLLRYTTLSAVVVLLLTASSKRKVFTSMRVDCFRPSHIPP